MSDEFEVIGFFYKVEQYKCRKYLDIKRKSPNTTTPDLMVVMMNPGSSYPINGDDDCSKPTQTVPDDTQEQIMKVMNECSLNYARIINISDIRTPESKKFRDFIKSDEGKSFWHSIFHDNRSDDLKDLFIEKVPIIYAWGVHRQLKKLAELAMEKMNQTLTKNPVGWKKNDGDNYSYYHPLPRNPKSKEQWLTEVISQLSQRKK